MRTLDAKVALMIGWTQHIRESARPACEGADWKPPEGEGEIDYYWDWVPPQFNGDQTYNCRLPRFSTDIKDAFALVATMDRVGFHWKFHSVVNEGNGLEVMAIFGFNNIGATRIFEAKESKLELLPMAIARCALEALEYRFGSCQDPVAAFLWTANDLAKANGGKS